MIEHRSGTGPMITYRIEVHASQSAAIPTGHVMASQIQRLQVDESGQLAIARIYYPPDYSDLSCLFPSAKHVFTAEHTANGWLPNTRPCWKAFTRHHVKGQKSYSKRIPTFGYRQHGGCGEVGWE